MEILDMVRTEKEAEPDPIEEANRKWAEASRYMALSLSEAVEAISLWSKAVLAPALEEFSRGCQELSTILAKSGIESASAVLELLRKREEERALVEKAKGYGLNGRVISLCGHRKERVRKKNLNRLRKEVELYERSIEKAGGQGAPEPADGYTGDRQPDEPVSGEAGVTEPNG